MFLFNISSFSFSSIKCSFFQLRSFFIYLYLLFLLHASIIPSVLLSFFFTFAHLDVPVPLQWLALPASLCHLSSINSIKKKEKGHSLKVSQFRLRGKSVHLWMSKPRGKKFKIAGKLSSLSLILPSFFYDLLFYHYIFFLMTPSSSAHPMLFFFLCSLCLWFIAYLQSFFLSLECDSWYIFSLLYS